jgi:hypothetical protein
MKIVVSMKRITWAEVVIDDATDHADAAQQARELDNSEVADYAHDETNEIYATEEVKQ